MRYQFVDCRWELGTPERGRELYLEGHIPGASFLDVERELSGSPGAPPRHGGRHPLPEEGRFADAASRAGIGPGVFVIAYDQGMTGGAVRLWWLLRHFGHDDASVLDGGIAAWLGPLRAGEEDVEPAEFVARPRAGDTINADELAARLDELVVYCGSGITACVDLLALAAGGRPDAKLYPGSWSDWSSRGLPAERGSD